VWGLLAKATPMRLLPKSKPSKLRGLSMANLVRNQIDVDTK
jgi:hypothetical protein